MTTAIIILIAIVALVCYARAKSQRKKSHFRTICPYCNCLLERDKTLDSRSEDGSEG